MIDNQVSSTTKDRLLAAGGVLGAIGASSCCVLPLAFALAGVSGAWIGTLTSLAPYQPLFVAVASLCVGVGLWRVYRSKQVACESPQCGTSISRRLTKTMLWIAAALIAIATSTGWWAPLLG